MPSLIRISACIALLACLCLFTPKKADAALTLCGLLCSCSISSTNIALGDYDPIHNTATTGTGTLTVTCKLLSSILGSLLQADYTLTLSQGGSSSFTMRKMTGPSSATLNYNLYTDAGMGTVWGDGGGVSQTIGANIQVNGVGINYSLPHTIYARIPAGQNARLGSYTDTITATLSF